MVNIDGTEGFEISQLEVNAQDRRKRLEEFRKKALEKKKEGHGEDDSPLMLLNPRSYRTVTSGISNVGEEVRDVMQKTDSEIQNIIDDAKNIQLGDELDISVLAPKKVDWDLKRGIQDKLDKLERRTNKAIIELVRERLQSEKGDLASGVSALQRHENLNVEE